MKLSRKIIKIQIIIAIAAFVFGYIRRLTLGDGYLEASLLRSGVATYSNWFDLTIGEIYSAINSLFDYSSSSFMFKFTWGLSTSIFISSITCAISIGCLWLEDKSMQVSK